MSTLRYIPRFGGASRLGSRRSSMMGPLADHLTDGIERIPSVIREEESPAGGIEQEPSMIQGFAGPAGPLTGGIERMPSMMQRSAGPRTSDDPMIQRFAGPTGPLTGGIERVPSMIFPDDSPVSSMTQSAGSGAMSSMTQSAGSATANSRLAPLRPVAYVPQSQAARYMGIESPIEPQSALPSYRADAHPSMNISTRPLSRQLQERGFPVEKKEPAVYAMPASDEPTPIQEGRYRMAEPSGTKASNVERDTRRIQIELADRGPDGTRLRPELGSEALGLSSSIRKE